MTRLDELNKLLKKTRLNPPIPEYARSVHPSGKNLKWLRKNLSQDLVESRLYELLQLNINELNQTDP